MLFAPPPPPPCVPAGAHVVAHRGSAAVYARNGGRFGCYGNRRPVTLLAPAKHRVGLTGLSTYRITGHDVAFVLHIGGIDTSSAFVEVYDLRARHRRESRAAVRNIAGPEFIEDVSSVALRRDGAVAWISAGHSLGAPGPPGAQDVREVHGARGGHDHVLSSAPNIETHSLRLQGRDVLWREAGVQHSAQL